jgi:tetratricopeptide (TPR) repeat protein
LKPRIAEFETALRAYREGDFSFCADALCEASQPSALALRTRALLRMGQSEEALAALAKVDFGALAHDDAGELLSMKATALCLLGEAETESALVDARVRAYSSGCAAVECEVEYATATIAWAQGRMADVLSAVDRVLSVSEVDPTWLRKSRSATTCSPGYWRARAFDLRGFAQAQDENFAGQAQSLLSAFREFDKASVHDIYVEGSMLYNLAVLARDIDSTEVSWFVAARADSVFWNINTKIFEYEVFRALGWCYAQHGDHLGAFRHLRRSADAAPSIPLRIVAILDRSFLARELGETFTATEDIEHALRLTSQVDWERATGAERAALYALASCIAPNEVARARQLWNRFQSLKSGVSPLELYENRRERAAQCQAHATILTAEGERERAITLLLESLDIWSSLGYVWRKAAVAADLAELTGEARFFELANVQARQQPHSWLARRLEHMTNRQGNEK